MSAPHRGSTDEATPDESDGRGFSTDAQEGRSEVLRIEDYGLVGDLHTAALVDRDGSIDWLCLPRFDSPACFAAMLEDEQAGFWQLAPTAGGLCTRRRYRGDSLILETEWDNFEGRVRVTDAMPPRGEAADVVRVVEA
jgi:GH15 family glucan-1,4-alpha-glucosidase